MSLGGGYQQSSSGSMQQSGGPFSDITNPGFRQGTANTLLKTLLGPSPFSQDRPGGILGSLLGRTEQPTNYQTPTLTASGLLPEQQGAFTEAVNQAMSRASGNFAGRGFLRPENIQAIAGSAAQNVAPGFANMIAQNVNQRTQAPLVIEDLIRQRFGDLMNAFNSGLTGLGAQSFGQSSSNSMGVQAQGGQTSGGITQNFGSGGKGSG